MKKVFGTLLSISMFISTTGFSATVCDEFFSTDVQETYKIVVDNENGSCIAEAAALEFATNVNYIGTVTETETPFDLFENATNEYGLFIVDESTFDEQQFIPLAVVLTAIAVDFTLIAAMYGAYATMQR